MGDTEERGRSVARIVDGIRTLEGAGFAVRRPFPTPQLDHFDPFLLLDEMGPADLGPGEAKGAPDHPHRGFETVTYLLAGRMEHRDSAGNSGELGPGDVQWMTAGGGVVHSEMPEAAFAATGGRMHGFQLWVNLPRRDKMLPPRYQDIPAAKIPVVRTPDGRVIVKVIAGEALGAKAVIETRTPIMYLHYTLAPGARTRQPVPKNYNAFVYVFGGQGLIGEQQHPARQRSIRRRGMPGRRRSRDALRRGSRRGTRWRRAESGETSFAGTQRGPTSETGGREGPKREPRAPRRN